MNKLLSLILTLILTVALTVSAFQISANAVKTEKMTQPLKNALIAMSNEDTIEVWILFNDSTDYSEEYRELERDTNEITQKEYGFTLATIKSIEQVHIWRQIRIELMYQRRHQRNLDLCAKLEINNDEIIGDWDPDDIYKALGSHFVLSKKKILALTDFEEIQSIDTYSHSQQDATEPPWHNPAMTESTDPFPRIMGDADKDGDLTILDATHIQLFKAELIDESGIDLEVSDYDQDGDVTILDATAIQHTLAVN